MRPREVPDPVQETLPAASWTEGLYITLCQPGASQDIRRLLLVQEPVGLAMKRPVEQEATDKPQIAADHAVTRRSESTLSNIARISIASASKLTISVNRAAEARLIRSWSSSSTVRRRMKSTVSSVVWR